MSMNATSSDGQPVINPFSMNVSTAQPTQQFNSQIATPTLSGAQSGLPDWMHQGQQQWQQQQTQLQQLQQQIQQAQNDLATQQQAAAGQAAPGAPAGVQSAAQILPGSGLNPYQMGASSVSNGLGSGPSGSGTGMGGKTVSPIIGGSSGGKSNSGSVI